MRAVVGAAVLGLTIGAGCGTPTPHVATATPASAARIAVRPFDADTDAGALLAEDVATELRKRGYDAEVVTAPDAAGRDLVVGGRVLRVDGGSWALRFWIGFGAGRARFAAEGAVSHVDGTPLARFRVQRSASGEPQMGLVGSDYLVGRCRVEVAQDIAEMIQSGEYREEDTD